MAGIIRKMLFGLVLEDAIVGEEHSYRFYEVAQRKVERKDALQLQRSGVSEERSWPEVNSRSTYRDILTLVLAKEKQAAAYYRTIAGRISLRSVEDIFPFRQLYLLLRERVPAYLRSRNKIWKIG